MKRKEAPQHGAPSKKKKLDIQPSANTHQANENISTFLSRGGKLKMCFRCHQCQNEETVTTPKVQTVSIDHEMDSKTTLDIVGIKDDEPLFGLHLQSSTNTSKTDKKYSFPCYDLASTDFENITESQMTKPIWVVKDRRKEPTCSSPTCLSMYEMAEKLGFVRKIVVGGSPTESRREILAASKGWYEKQTPATKWYNKPHSDVDVDKKTVGSLWKDFLTRKKCIKCKTSDDDVKFGNPYCHKCMREINNPWKEPIAKRINITEDEKMKLEKKYQWLRKIPGKWKPGSPCTMCGDEYIKKSQELSKFWELNDRHIQGYVWWFGEKKCICTRCIEKKRVELEKKNKK